jgi:CBS domain-containing protein
MPEDRNTFNKKLPCGDTVTSTSACVSGCSVAIPTIRSSDGGGEPMRASGTMTRRVIVVPPELPLDAAWDILQRHHIRHLPVLAGGALVGILSDRDVLLHASVAEDGDVAVPASTKVATAMTPAPYVCSPSTDVADLARLMLEHKLDAVPVVGAGERLVGLVTSSDLLSLLLEPEPAAARPLPFLFELDARSVAVA